MSAFALLSYISSFTASHNPIPMAPKEDLAKPSSASPASGQKAKVVKKKKKVVDSWEDEDLSAEDDSPPSPPPQDKAASTTAAPSYYDVTGQSSAPLAASWSAAEPSGTETSRRPEKTDAVARRLIAGALGVRVPKQTEEQKAYNKSLRETESKRREEERAAAKRKEEELEKAKKAIWED